MTLNRLLERLRAESWKYLENTVCQGSNDYGNFTGASGAVRNPASSNISRWGLAVSYGKKEVAVRLEKECNTLEHIRVHPSDSPTSTIFIEWQNGYKGLNLIEKKAVDEVVKQKARRFIDPGSKYVAVEEFRIVYSL